MKNYGFHSICIVIFVGLILLSFSSAVVAKRYSDETASLPIGLPSKASTKLKIFLFIGQSQISGRGRLMEKDRALNINKNAFVFGNDYQWKIAKEPTDSAYNQVDRISRDNDAGVSPAVTFTKEMNRLRPDWLIGVVHCSKGGTLIKRWQRDLKRNSLYGSCVNRAREAAKEGEIIGVIFQQGESDAIRPKGNRPFSPDTWGILFKKMITDLRHDLGISQLPVVYTQMGKNKSDRFVNWTKLQAQQANANVDNSIMVKTDDLPLKDYVHYTADGYRTLGARYAKAYIELTEKK